MDFSIEKLNLDTFEATQLDSVECKDALGFQLLGGTEEYQIYSLIKDDETLFYKLDYESCESEQIELFQSGYERILPEENENSFYYLSVEGGERNLYQYDIDSRKISFALKMRKFWRMPEGILLDQTCVENVRKESCTGSEHGLRSEKRRCSYWIIMENTGTVDATTTSGCRYSFL